MLVSLELNCRQEKQQWRERELEEIKNSRRFMAPTLRNTDPIRQGERIDTFIVKQKAS